MQRAVALCAETRQRAVAASEQYHERSAADGAEGVKRSKEEQAMRGSGGRENAVCEELRRTEREPGAASYRERSDLAAPAASAERNKQTICTLPERCPVCR
jgi:hypothetical protein